MINLRDDPLPWSVRLASDRCGWAICDAFGGPICVVSNRETADHIVAAVNLTGQCESTDALIRAYPEDVAYAVRLSGAEEHERRGDALGKEAAE